MRMSWMLQEVGLTARTLSEALVTTAPALPRGGPLSCHTGLHFVKNCSKGPASGLVVKPLVGMPVSHIGILGLSSCSGS